MYRILNSIVETSVTLVIRLYIHCVQFYCLELRSSLFYTRNLFEILQNSMAPRAGALEHTGHDNHCMPNPNPFPILLERLDGIEAIGQEIFDDSRCVKPGLCWSTIYECLLEC